ncbi:putative UPF0481 protein At3g02645 [Elaeis guineensis]|uniref:UPF0481 protein At3g02645 n=1 Tax=Elaeis guineensis var. tenera TaxID=51953 RepID=A0A6I9Q8Y8_ELAGV|nr:putative UPF0481 protein At3g02645 [Elaeis guineensis]
MGSQDSSITSSNDSLLFDERRWVIQIRNTFEEEAEEGVRIPVSVFSVPKTLLSTKPEAYVPQLFALGPYHHWHPQLYEMERYKLATAKRTQKQLQNLKLEQAVEHFTGREHKIRSHYHRHLDLSGETLAWMMVIDGSFLLEFLRNYSDAERKPFRKVPSMSHMVDAARMKLVYNSILRDIVMLENQIPLHLVRKILRFQRTSNQIADNELSTMLIGFVKEVCPFKVMDNLSSIDTKRYAHLLQLLYFVIVPKVREGSETNEIEHHLDVPKSNEETPPEDPSYVKNLFNSVWSSASGLKILNVLIKKPLVFLVKVPWKIISHLPGISILAAPIVNLLFNRDEKSEDEESGNKPPLVEEIMIPSVTELTKAGVKFSPTRGDLTTIAFDVKTATLHLPTVSLDVNTEVLLRNLVAYETSVESGPMVFTRYTELINGIVDTEEDVKLLRQKGIILNRMKNDEEVANLWNGMSKSVRLTKVAFIDKVLVDVNKFYNSRWSVKSRKFMKTYVFGSWQILTLLAAILLLFLTCVQAFCSVYSCGTRWSFVTDTGAGGNGE